MTIIKKFEPIENKQSLILAKARIKLSLVSRKLENKKKFPKKYIILTVIGLFSLILIEIWVSNTVIAYGEKYEKLSDLEKNLKMENQILENEISNNSSLKVISSKSAELGFYQSTGIQYIR